MVLWEYVLLGVAALLAVLALIISVSTRLRLMSASRNRFERSGDAVAGGRRLVAFVANPTKPDVPELRGAVERACASLELAEPLWLETTEADPGSGQARAALEAGAEVVVAVGGDGTVRAVASAMIGTDVPMAVLPLGTGNLLARNLEIPIGDLEDALLIALEGRDRHIDVGRLRVLRVPDAEPDARGSKVVADVGSEHLFLVIGGIGFDAAMVADANSRLKAKMGWVAYFVAGIRHLHGKRLEMRIELDGQDPVRVKGRSLLIGNCGRLPGGLILMPDAQIDDGILDVAAIDTRGGIAGWAQLFGEVVMQGFGVSTDLPNKIGRIDHTQCRRIRVGVRGGEQVQVDGEIVGRATVIESWVDHNALTVRVPRNIRLARNRSITA